MYYWGLSIECVCVCVYVALCACKRDSQKKKRKMKHGPFNGYRLQLYKNRKRKNPQQIQMDCGLYLE